MGRKTVKDLKIQVPICIEASKINAHGGKKALQDFMYLAASEMAEKLNHLKNRELDKIIKK